MSPTPPWTDLDNFCIANGPNKNKCSLELTRACTTNADCTGLHAIDTCGDITSSNNPILSSIQSIQVACIDKDGNGDVDPNVCLSWQQSGANSTCTSPLQTVVGAPSKCNCQVLPGITIAVPGVIKVDKKTTPLADPTIFDFTLSTPTGSTPFTLTDTQAPFSSGPLPLGSGYSVAETVPDGWELTSSTCTSDQEGRTQTPDNIVLHNGETVTCTFNDKKSLAHLTITKVATEANYNVVGQIIHYTIVATNDGETTVAAVTVADPSVSSLTCTPVNGSSLAPAASMTCSATHTVTQADIDAGHYANTACVDDGANGAAQACASQYVPAVQTPHLSITKSATPEKYDAVGQVINYTIVATNDGNTTLAAVTVADPGVSGLTCTPANGSSLAPAASHDLHGDSHGRPGRH